MWIGFSASARDSQVRLIQSCNKLAVFELRQCLAETDYRQNDFCWSDSHLAYRDCTLGLAAEQASQHLEPPTKEQLNYKRRLDKQLKSSSIRAHLMGAANQTVYLSVLSRSLKSMDERLSLTQGKAGRISNSEKKTKQHLIARREVFSQYTDWIDQGLNCEQLTEKIKSSSQQISNADIEQKKAFRELKELLPSYCRLTK